MRGWSISIAAVAGLSLSTARAANTVTDYYDDPFAYCVAAGDLDVPGKHYTGPTVNLGFSSWQMSVKAREERVVWRCAGGKVYWCYLLSMIPCATDAQFLNPEHWHVVEGGVAESVPNATSVANIP